MPGSDDLEALRREILAKMNAAILESNASTNKGIGALNLLIERATLKADHALRTGDDLRPRVVLLERQIAKTEGRGEATQQILTDRRKTDREARDYDLRKLSLWQKFLLAVAGVSLPFLGAAADRVLALLAGGNP